MLVGLIVSFCFLWFFKLDGVAVDYKNPLLLLKFISPTISLIAGLYFGLRFISGKKIANQIGAGLAGLLVIAYVVGLLLH